MLFFFFFKQKTAYEMRISDWSSDVCSSDLAKQDIRVLESSLSLYKLDNFNYPSTQQGLEALVAKPSGDPEPKNYKSGGYIQSLPKDPWGSRSEEHTSELQSLMRISYAVFCLKKKKV